VGSEDEEDSDYMEGRESGEDREGGENEEDSDSGSDFRENKGSPGSSDEEEQDSSAVTNLKKLARKGKRRRSRSKEESASSDSSDSDASDVSFFDEFKDGGPKLGSRRRDSLAQQSASDEEVLVIEGKRQRQALDYKRLYDVSLNELHAHFMLCPSSFDDYAQRPNFCLSMIIVILMIIEIFSFGSQYVTRYSVSDYSWT